MNTANGWLIQNRANFFYIYYRFLLILLDSTCVKKGHFLSITLLLLMIAAPQGSILRPQKIDPNV